MPRRFSPKLSVALALLVLSAWSPWLTQEFARVRAVDSFNHAWQSVIDGCGTNCNGCGAVSSQRVPFGVLVKIEYACGLMSADSPEYHQQATAFISPFGTIHGLPKP